MFVQFSLNAVAACKSQKGFATSLTTARCIIFPMHTGLEKFRADGQGVCPGYDDNEEATISYFVIKGPLENKGVIHQ